MQIVHIVLSFAFMCLKNTLLKKKSAVYKKNKYIHTQMSSITPFEIAF